MDAVRGFGQRLPLRSPWSVSVRNLRKPVEAPAKKKPQPSLKKKKPAPKKKQSVKKVNRKRKTNLPWN